MFVILRLPTPLIREGVGGRKEMVCCFASSRRKRVIDAKYENGEEKGSEDLYKIKKYWDVGLLRVKGTAAARAICVRKGKGKGGFGL